MQGTMDSKIIRSCLLSWRVCLSHRWRSSKTCEGDDDYSRFKTWVIHARNNVVCQSFYREAFETPETAISLQTQVTWLNGWLYFLWHFQVVQERTHSKRYIYLKSSQDSGRKINMPSSQGTKGKRRGEKREEKREEDEKGQEGKD